MFNAICNLLATFMLSLNLNAAKSLFEDDFKNELRLLTNNAIL